MAPERLVSATEVEKHNKPGDLWLVIGESVWDFSEFGPRHPGGFGGMCPPSQCALLQFLTCVQLFWPMLAAMPQKHTVMCTRRDC
jgi:hypothetical protein